MKSEELRKELTSLLEEYGMKKGIVAKQTGLSKSILSSWFSGRLILKEEEIEIVEKYYKDLKAKLLKL